MTNIIKLPGLIDIHVHLRDPGQTYKEDFYTGTTAALAGGITTVFDMPNNLQPIFTYERLIEKMAIAQKKAVCDYGFYFGTDGKNIAEFEKVKDLVVGLKIYLNLTTGNILIEDEQLLDAVFKSWPKDKIIVVHAEGEKVDLAIHLTEKYGNRLHITHLHNRNTLDKVLLAKKRRLSVTYDVTPHHLFLTNKDGAEGLHEIRPRLQPREDVDYLWSHLKDIDCICTDHAPHTIEEKKSSKPPPGFPGLETMLPLLLTAVKNGRLTIDDIIRLTNANPQKLFGFRQDEKSYVEIDLNEKYTINNESLKTKCGWSPFVGWPVYGRVKNVFIRSKKVFENGKVLTNPGFGRNVID